MNSVKAVDGVCRASEFAGCWKRFVFWNRLFAAKELALLSDGAVWIWNVREEFLPGRKAVCILDQFNALEYSVATVRALTPDRGEREAQMETIRQ